MTFFLLLLSLILLAQCWGLVLWTWRLEKQSRARREAARVRIAEKLRDHEQLNR